MSDSEVILEMYKAIQRIEGRLENFATRDETDEKFDQILRILDRQGGMLDTDETERLALNKQVNRHEDWITRAAPKVSVRYTG